MIYDPDKHHPPKGEPWRTGRRSIRLKQYDYSQAGGYFVTVCVQNRQCLLGEIVNSEMKMNQYGEIVRECWDEIPQKYQNVETDEFAVMPNHVHGIIIINDSEPNDNNDDGVGARLSRPDEKTKGATQRRPYKITLGKIVACLKYESAKRINEINDSYGTKIWQRNYFEHTIRNEKELNRIREYIINNPARWDEDEENLAFLH